MSDPILINQIITSLGLAGKDADAKRAELEKLSNAELTKILSNSKEFDKTSPGVFLSLDYNKWDKNIKMFNPEIIAFQDTDFSSSSSNEKVYTSTQQKELDRFLGDFLFNSSTAGLAEITDYNKNVGWANITDRAVNGFKVLTGQEDRIALQNRLSEEQKESKKLKDIANKRPAVFESMIERKYGVPYSHKNVEALKNKAEEYTRITAHHEKYQQLSQGLKELKNIIREEQEYNQARKNLKGPALAALTPPKTSSNQKFGEIMLNFCNGDKELLNTYMQKLNADYSSRDEIVKDYPNIVSNLETQMKTAYEKELNGKDYALYTNEFNSACQRVIGRKDAKTAAKNFVENAKTQAAYTEIGLTIATSLLLPGSSAVKATAQKLGPQGVKAAMTFTMGAAPATLETLNAASSEAGFTDEKIDAIKEKFKNGMLYGSFGAYASGPLGQAVEKVLSKNPAAFSNIVSKTMAKTSETTADVLFDRMTSDLSFSESLKQNGGLNFGMMFAGGILSKVLKKNFQELTVTKNSDGSFSLKDTTGKKILNNADETQIAEFVLAKGLNVESEKPSAHNNDEKATLDILKQLGTSEAQIEKFKENCSQDVLEFINKRVNSSDFNPLQESYFANLTKENIDLIKMLYDTPNFDNGELGLVANAAYTRNYAIQIAEAFRKGVNIIPGCQRIAKQKPDLNPTKIRQSEAEALQKAYQEAVNRITENTSLSKEQVITLSEFANIRQPEIQDLIIYFESKGQKNYHSLLEMCNKNIDDISYSETETAQRANIVMNALKAGVELSDITSIMRKCRDDFERLNISITKEIEIKNKEKLEIQNFKNQLLDKYKNPEIKTVIESIVNDSKIPKELLYSLDKILGKNPSLETCMNLKNSINNIHSDNFSLSVFKLSFKNKLNPNNWRNNIQEFLGLNKNSEHYTFNVDSGLEKILKSHFSDEIGNVAIENISKPLTEQDITNIKTLLEKASNVIEVSDIEPHKLLLLYQNIMKSDEIATQWISKMTSEQSAFILNSAKADFVPEEIYDMLMQYKAIPSILNHNSTSGMKNEISKYLANQKLQSDVKCNRTEGFMPISGAADNSFGGCLQTITLNGEFSGQTIDSVMKRINEMSDIETKKMEFLKLKQSVLSNNYVATNDRFMSCTLTIPSGGASSGVSWDFNLKKGSNALFLEGINMKGERGVWELLVQKGSKIQIKDLTFDPVHNIWNISADVTTPSLITK